MGKLYFTKKQLISHTKWFLWQGTPRSPNGPHLLWMVQPIRSPENPGTTVVSIGHLNPCPENPGYRTQVWDKAWYAAICISLAYYGLLRKHIYINILHFTFPTQRLTACNQALQVLPEKPIIPDNLIPHQVERDVVGDGWDILQLHHTLIVLMIIWMNPLKFHRYRLKMVDLITMEW